MEATLTWYGVCTFKLEIADRVLFLDTFVDRAPGAPEVGLRSADVDRADFLFLGHSHFDHALGADTIAQNTGATVVGSYESIRVMSEEGVDESQLMPVAGGERVEVADGVRVSVFPGLHSCIWAPSSRDATECLVGDVGLSHQDHQHRIDAKIERLRAMGPAHNHDRIPDVRGDGGSLVFLIETPDGSIWWNDSAGYWSSIAGSLNPQVAILAAAGRGNVDGEPMQGTLAEYVAGQAELLAPQKVILGHHDNWFPPYTREMDTGPIEAEIKDRAGSGVELLTMDYNTPMPLRLR